jgi:hypothetical protein
MEEHYLNDLVKYVSNNEINQGSIIRYLRNGSIIVKNETHNKDEKILAKNIVSNISIFNKLNNYINDLELDYNYNIKYTTELNNYINNLESDYSHNIKYTTDLKHEINEIYNMKFVLCMVILFLCADLLCTYFVIVHYNIDILNTFINNMLGY